MLLAVHFWVHRSLTVFLFWTQVFVTFLLIASAYASEIHEYAPPIVAQEVIVLFHRKINQGNMCENSVKFCEYLCEFVSSKSSVLFLQARVTTGVSSQSRAQDVSCCVASLWNFCSMCSPHFRLSSSFKNHIRILATMHLDTMKTMPREALSGRSRATRTVRWSVRTDWGWTTEECELWITLRKLNLRRHFWTLNLN